MNKNLNFEPFEEGRGWYGKGPKINILAKGGIGFSTSFMKSYAPKNPPHVALSYASDETNHYMAFSFTENPDRVGALKVYYPKKNYGMIQCVSFFKKYGINYKKQNGKYDVEEHEDNRLGKLFVIKIPKL